MVRAAFACVALAAGGCDVVFRIDMVVPRDADAIEDAALMLCADAHIDDPFDDGLPCETWGSANGDVGCQISETTEGLVFQPVSMTGSRCSCNARASVPFTERGISVKIGSVLGGTDADYTVLSLAPPIDLTIGVSNGTLRFASNDGAVKYGSPVLYDSDSMPWWRLRRDGGEVIAQFSANAVSWTTFGERVARSETQATVNLSAGLNLSNSTVDGTAIYQRLIACR